MAVYTLTDCATTRTTSRWGSCMHSDRHTVGDADLFNDQVGKIGKNRHRLILDQEMGALEILFCPLFYHIAIIGAAEEPRGCTKSQATFFFPFSFSFSASLASRASI